MSPDIVSLKRVSVIYNVCHSREQYNEELFYMYMCHFVQLHIRLPFDNFTMGVLRLLNVAPTQLHPNSYGYLHVFRLLCRSLYIRSSRECFLYFYNTHPKDPITWLSLVSRPGINILDAYSQSFKRFKYDFFRVVVKPASWSCSFL